MRFGTYYRYELLRRLQIFDKIDKGDKILDIGGFDGYALSKINASKKILIDPEAKKEFDGILYLKKDFFEYNFKKQKFNLILSLDVLEHIPKEKESKYFYKIFTLLKKDGMAIITIPSKDIKIFPNFLRGRIGRKWGHYKCLGYSREELKKLLNKSNIRNYEIHSCSARYYLNGYLLIKFLQIFLPKDLFKRVLSRIANKDAKLNLENSQG